MKSITRPDRVERGVLISARGLVISSRPGQWTVRSETEPNTIYRVTERACECADWKKTQTICKHMYASAGFVAAFIILALRKATSIELAGRILTPAYQMLASLPTGYQRTLENEYAQAVKRISAQSAQSTDKNAKSDSDSPTVEKPSTISPNRAMQAPAPILIIRECTHPECLTSRCNYDVRIGGIAV